MPGWEWMQPGTEAEGRATRRGRLSGRRRIHLAYRLLARTSSARPARSDRGARRTKDYYPAEAANSEMLIRLIGPLDTVTVIELLDSPGSFSEAEREVMQRGLFHHHPNAL